MKAVLRNGTIQPTEPLPTAWREGQELVVESAGLPGPDAGAAEAWYRELEAAVAQIDPEQGRVLDAAVREIREAAKAQARKELGLP